MTKEEFKQRWESDEDGGGITWNDIEECAQAWGIAMSPATMPMEKVRYLVLLAAKTNDAEDFAVA